MQATKQKRTGRNQDHNHSELRNDTCMHSRVVGSAAVLKRNSEQHCAYRTPEERREINCIEVQD